MLSDRVLVLNRSWTAVNISTVRRAVALVYQGYARVVDAADYATYDFDAWTHASLHGPGRCLRSVDIRFRVPEVIVLSFFNGGHAKEVKFSRRNILERDRHTCQYCGRRYDRSQLTVDHVIPRSRGGESTWENVLTACVSCNTRKGSRTLEETGLAALSVPARPHWPTFVGSRLARIRIPSWEKFLGMPTRRGAAARSHAPHGTAVTV